jgi:hypothetical protein
MRWKKACKCRAELDVKRPPKLCDLPARHKYKHVVFQNDNRIAQGNASDSPVTFRFGRRVARPGEAEAVRKRLVKAWSWRAV